MHRTRKVSSRGQKGAIMGKADEGAAIPSPFTCFPARGYRCCTRRVSVLSNALVRTLIIAYGAADAEIYQQRRIRTR